jgi:8-oxo-dGTP pyrophosphatase MutT (NUDIX family)
MRPGWGSRHPVLVPVLESATPAMVRETAWRDGTLPLRVAAYLGIAAVPDELVTSVRCLVQVGDEVVVCTDRDGTTHALPGGRRQQGETLSATAVREVHEETGWLVDEPSLVQLGWLHIEHLSAMPDDHPFPHPDFCQIVLAGRAREHAVGHGANWIDSDGYVIGSQLMTVDRALQAVSDDESRVYLALLGRQLG